MNLIFLLGLPRSGSTLLQSILGNHPDITTISEPWILLPISHCCTKNGVHAWYNHVTASNAINNFLSKIKNNDIELAKAIRAFAMHLYKLHCNSQKKYFLDKTPRYFSIIPLIKKAFPDAKYIFLFRNPLDIMASIINSWHNGKLQFTMNSRDVFEGPNLISEGYELLRNRAINILYENLVNDQENEIQRICKYLELEYFPEMIYKPYNQNYSFPYGDKTGIKKYSNISKNSTQKWKKTFNTNYRRKFAKKYIQSLPETTLNNFGVTKINLLNDLDEIPVKISLGLRDRADRIFDCLWNLIDLSYVRERLRTLKQGKKLYSTR